ncbi:thioesterase family protein [Variovorax humicola]|uniref:Thioesterase family protein n=1 Tax=Variovorax humicola TaxID=1769758 RepID=A0ABU8W9C8_9BURK
MTDVRNAVFRTDGAAFIPGDAAIGPWSADALQGSATAALAVRILEADASTQGRQISRLSFDFWRPANRSPIEVQISTVRDGSKARTVAIDFEQQGKPVMRCSALLLRTGLTPELPSFEEEARFEPPEQGAEVPSAAFRMSPFFAGVGVRMARGQILEPGPAAAWMKLERPLVDDEAPSPLAQAASASDLVAGISQWVHPSKLGFVNADLTINLRRPPAGDWMLLDARTLPGPNGSGYATGALHDRSGPFGQCSSSLLFEVRG